MDGLDRILDDADLNSLHIAKQLAQRRVQLLPLGGELKAQRLQVYFLLLPPERSR